MSNPSEAPKRFQGRLFFLTYPRNDTPVDELVSFCKALTHFKRGIFCQERHADGGYHLHAAVEFGRRIERKYDFFDLNGTHGDYQSCGSWGACVNYCRKDESAEIRYEGCTPEDATQQSTGGRPESNYYAECEARPSQRDWFEYALQRRIPYAYAEKFWKLAHGAKPPTIYQRPTGDDAGIIHDFHLSATRLDADGYVCVVCGPSGIGKTTWALREAPLPALFVTHRDDLQHFNAKEHNSIIFDEMRCTGETDTYGRNKGKWPLVEQIKLLTSDTPVSIHCRYTLARIPSKVVKIFSCTDKMCFNDDIQTRRRIHQIVNLYEHDDIWM